MKKMISLIGMVLLLSVVGCGMSSDDSVEKQVSVDVKSNVPDTPPTEGMCAGWQKSLAKGKYIYEVESCLREKALRDRAAAVEEANVMLDWEIKEDYFTELKPLIVTLVKYPEVDSLKVYLDSMSLLPNEPDEHHRLDEALTASDYLEDLGNVYWFDVETGFFPNNHDYLMDELAGLSDFKNADFDEVAPSDFKADDEPYLLKATINGKRYQQKAENHGDWYDLSAVLNLLNRIAIDQSSQNRFVTLPTEDQTATVWVADNKALTKLLNEGLMHVSSEEASMVTGKAFEAQALQSYE